MTATVIPLYRNAIENDRHNPTVECEPRGKRWRFWCRYCWCHHYHSPEPGHRKAHCRDIKSPYRDRGYTLKLKR